MSNMGSQGRVLLCGLAGLVVLLWGGCFCLKFVGLRGDCVLSFRRMWGRAGERCVLLMGPFL